MGVKAIKEKYRIEGHIVQMRGDNIIIGSAYISDIITINREGQVVKGLNENNKELVRYVNEMIPDAHSGELKRLFHLEDSFGVLYPVYTAQKGRVVKKYCEEYKWPNTTTDGQMIYDNFFQSRAEARAYLKRDTILGVKYAAESLLESLRAAGEEISRKSKRLITRIWHYIVSRILW